MKTMQFFKPAMRCPAGLCGAGEDAGGKFAFITWKAEEIESDHLPAL